MLILPNGLAVNSLINHKERGLESAGRYVRTGRMGLLQRVWRCGRSCGLKPALLMLHRLRLTFEQANIF